MQSVQHKTVKAEGLDTEFTEVGSENTAREDFGNEHKLDENFVEVNPDFDILEKSIDSAPELSENTQVRVSIIWIKSFYMFEGTYNYISYHHYPPITVFFSHIYEV